MSNNDHPHLSYSHVLNFVVRRPLLDGDEFIAWSQQAVDRFSAVRCEEEKFEEQIRAERNAMVTQFANPLLREALAIAAPSLLRAVDENSHGVQSGERLCSSLYRYFARASTRATPFGLFAGNAVGGFASEGHSREIPSELWREGLVRSLRVDLSVLFALRDRIAADRLSRESMCVEISQGAYKLGDSIRIYHRRTTGYGDQVNELRSVARTKAIDVVYSELATHPLPFAELARLLRARGLPEKSCKAFIHSLLDVGLLDVSLHVPTSGARQLDTFLAQLREIDGQGAVVEGLEQVANAIASLSRIPVGASDAASAIVALDHLVGAQCEAGTPGRRLHVDLVWRPEAPSRAAPTLVEADLARIKEAVWALWVCQPPHQDRLQRFREEFKERYGEQWISLLEVLDEELGIGFQEVTGGFDGASPLLEGIAVSSYTEEQSSVNARDALLLEMVVNAAYSGQNRIQLDITRMSEITKNTRGRLPHGIDVVATRHSRRAEYDEGYTLSIHGAFGPAAGRMIARFAQSDRHVEVLLNRCSSREQKLFAHETLAEIVYQGEARASNLACLPAVRAIEIEALGRSSRSGVRVERLADLEVTVQDGYVRIRAREDHREIIPRQTNMLVARDRHPGIYRFLIAVGAQGARSKFVWDWGQLRSLPKLPRVEFQEVVLTPARWKMDVKEVDTFCKLESSYARFMFLRQWRERLCIPRWVRLVEGDNVLSVDLENPLCIDALTAPLRRANSGLFIEELGHSGEPTSADCHEFVVPLLSSTLLERPRPAVDRATASSTVRLFPPISTWHSYKLYGGRAALNRLLVAELGPLLENARRFGDLDQWFFIRYNDPEFHLRLRLRPSDRRTEEYRPLRDALHQAARKGVIRRLVIDSYFREIERYGGDSLIERAEAVFAAESGLVIEASSAGLDLSEKGWLLALHVINGMLANIEAAGFSRDACVEQALRHYARPFAHSRDFKKSASRKYRQLRGEIDGVFNSATRLGWWGQFDAQFTSVGSALDDLIGSYVSLSSRDLVSRPIESIVASLMHMAVNRSVVHRPNDHETVIYDLLRVSARAVTARRKPASDHSVSSRIMDV